MQPTDSVIQGQYQQIEVNGGRANLSVTDRVEIPFPHAENAASKKSKKILDREFVKWQKFGFPEEIFHNHPEFVKFIFKNGLHYMIRYHQKNHPEVNHQIKIIENNPHIFFKGNFVDWQAVKEVIESEKQLDEQQQVLRGFDGNGKLKGWFYTHDRGLDEWRLFDWDQTSIKPIRQLPPENCPKHYVYTICTAKENDSYNVINDSHSYIELTTPEGKVYNFGLWAPESFIKAGFKGMKYGFATEFGRLGSPDIFEFMGEKVTTIKSDIPITEEQYNKIWSWLLDKKENGIPFSWVESNCSKFVTDTAALIGIEIDSIRTPPALLLPEKIEKAVYRAWNKTPKILQILLLTVKKIIMLVPNILINTIRCLFFGATKGVFITELDEDGNEKIKKVAVINSISDFFLKEIEFQRPRSIVSFQKEYNMKVLAGV